MSRYSWTFVQAIGVLHLARSGVAVRRAGPGGAEGFAVSVEDVRCACVALALAAVGPAA